MSTSPTRSSRPVIGLVILGLVVAGVVVGRTWSQGADGDGAYVLDADLGAIQLRRPEVGQALLATARRAYMGTTVEPGALATLEPHPAIVCGTRPPAAPVCRREVSDTLVGSVVAAAEEVRAAAPDGLLGFTVDVELLDVEVSWSKPGHRRRDPGVWGYRAGDAVVPPVQVLTRGIYGGGAEDKSFRVEVLASELEARLPPGSAVRDVKALPLHRFRTVAWTEDGRGGSLHTYRVHPFHRPEIGPDDLALRAAWAADHLASTVEPNGRVRYLFDPIAGKERSGYNLLRHGGTTYALLQAYQRFEHEPWLDASEAAIRYLLAHSRRDVRQGPFGGGEVLWVDESRWIKLGGAGLALVMLTQHMQATGSDLHLEDARAYARFLVSQQQESGEFVYFADKTPGGPGRDRTSAYYPGEAILGLAQLYAIDPDPLWLDTATRGADWLIDVRDAGKGPKKLANDHWLMIALSHLVKHTGDARYVDHSLALVDAVEYQAERNRGKVATHPDYFGGYYDPPRSTPAATRGEGLVAVLDTCALAERDCAHVEALLRDTVTHELWSQYLPATSWWSPTPGKVVGGFAGGIMDLDLRNDFTQHNLSSVLGLERHLRDGSLPGGPTWSWARQEPYGPGAAPPVDQLLGPLRSIRGMHRWDVEEPAGVDVDGPSPDVGRP